MRASFVPSLLAMLAWLSVGCAQPSPTPNRALRSAPPVVPAATSTPTVAPSPASTVAPTSTPAPTSAPTPTLTLAKRPTPTPRAAPPAAARPTAAPDPTPSATPEPTPTPFVPTPTPPSPTKVPAPALPTVPPPTPTADSSQRLQSSLPWFKEGDRTEAQESALSALSQLISLDQDLGITVAGLPWIVDGIAEGEPEPLERLVSLARKDTSLAAAVAGLPWFLDGIVEVEQKALQNIAVLAFWDASLAKAAADLAWVADGIEGQEWASLGDLAVIAEENIPLANTIAAFPSHAGGFDQNTRFAVYYLRVLSEADAGLADGLAAGSFLANSIEEHDVSALTTLRDLLGYPDDLALLVEQSWFTDGITDDEAVLVTVLSDQARIAPEEFRSLLAGHYLDSSSAILPLAGEIRLHILRLGPPSPTDTALQRARHMTQLEDAVLLTEQFMDIPFPQSDVILLFAEPGVGTAGTYRGTHMIISPPQEILGDFRRVIAHEVGHYYWGSSVSPVWFNEGGSDFLASYVVQQVYGDSPRGRRTEVEAGNRFCRNQGMSNIQKLVDNLETIGYSEQVTRSYFVCNYTNGELLFLNLSETMGLDAFQETWRELHDLTGPGQGTWTEDGVHAAFLRHVPTGQVNVFEELYARVHGGDFSG